MGYKTKIQEIKRANSKQYYVNFPAFVTHAMHFGKGDEVEWEIENRDTLTLKRVKDGSENEDKKKL